MSTAKTYSYYLKRCEELKLPLDNFDFEHEVDSNLSYAEQVNFLEENLFSIHESKENIINKEIKKNKKELLEQQTKEELKEQLQELSEEWNLRYNELIKKVNPELMEEIEQFIFCREEYDEIAQLIGEED